MFYWWCGLFPNPSIHCAMAISLAWSSESACPALNTNSSAAACCRLWLLLTLLSPAREGSQEEKTPFSFSGKEGGVLCPWSRRWLRNGCQLTRAAHWCSPVTKHLHLWFHPWRVSMFGSMILTLQLKLAEYAGVQKWTCAKWLHFLTIYRPPFLLQGYFKCVLNIFSFYRLLLIEKLEAKCFILIMCLGFLETSEFHSVRGQAATSARA